MGATFNIELPGQLADHVAASTGEGGRYADAADYVRDLIRRDLASSDGVAALRDELQRAFTEPDEAYTDWDVEAFLLEPEQRAA